MKEPFLLVLALAFLLSGVIRAQDQSPASSDKGTGIEGAITMSPVQGGPTRAGSVDSRPLAHIEFEVRQGDRVIASFRTDEQGHFRLSLEAGHYTISRKAWKSAIGSYGPFEVTVGPGQMTVVNWACDTGIR